MHKFLFSALSLFITFQANAYQNLMTTGDLLKPNQLQAMGYIESIFNELHGTNINVRGTYGINDELQADMELGTGHLNMMFGAFLKWVPIPDYQKQPAIGVRAGFNYINADPYSQTSLTAMPFVSKAIDNTSHGRFVPYIGLPLAFNSNKNSNYFSSRLVLGTEWTSPSNQQFHAIAELGLELSKSFSSLNIGASYDF